MAAPPPTITSSEERRGCPKRTGERCRCSPTYQAQVWSRRDAKRITKTFPTLAAAKTWRQDAAVALRQGTLQAGQNQTLRQASDEWIDMAKRGLIRNRSGDVYKPLCCAVTSRRYATASSPRPVPTSCVTSAAPMCSASSAA